MAVPAGEQPPAPFEIRRLKRYVTTVERQPSVEDESSDMKLT